MDEGEFSLFDLLGCCDLKRNGWNRGVDIIADMSEKFVDKREYQLDDLDTADRRVDEITANHAWWQIINGRHEFELYYHGLVDESGVPEEVMARRCNCVDNSFENVIFTAVNECGRRVLHWLVVRKKG